MSTEPMFTAAMYGSAESAREAEVKWLRAENEALRADAEWKFTADLLPEDGRLVLFEVDAKAPSRFEYLDGQVFACTYYTANERYGSAFGVPGLTIRASRWRYVQGPPAIDAACAARESTHG